MFNYNLLDNRIAQVCGSQQEFTGRLGISLEELRERLTGSTDLYCEDMERGIEISSIPIAEAERYFFR